MVCRPLKHSLFCCCFCVCFLNPINMFTQVLHCRSLQGCPSSVFQYMSCSSTLKETAMLLWLLVMTSSSAISDAWSWLHSTVTYIPANPQSSMATWPVTPSSSSTTDWSRLDQVGGALVLQFCCLCCACVCLRSTNRIFQVWRISSVPKKIDFSVKVVCVSFFFFFKRLMLIQWYP